MNANELAKKLEKTGWNIPLTEMECFEIATMLRQQQAEMEFLKKEILEKHEDWKHEGQQAANARAEIEALKKVLQEVVRISDRNHGAWNKAKELLK